MTTHKEYLKTWSGTCHFICKERFSSLNAAGKQVVPSKAAEITVDENTVSYQHSTIKKEVASDNTLPTPGKKDPGKGKGEKVSPRKDNETKEKK